MIGTATIVVAVFVFWGFSPFIRGSERGSNVVHAAAPAVIINEVMWAGSTVSTSDEWIELYNPTDNNVDISGWLLEHAAGSSLPGLTLPANSTIGPHGYFIISNFAKDHASNAFKVDVDWVTSSISLLNTNNGNLILKNSNGEVIDQASGTPWLAGESASATKKSMERGVEAPDGLVATSWHTATASADTKNFGTPRAANSVPPVNAAPVPAISGVTSGLVGQVLSWSAEDSSDVDNNELTFSWTYGDGTTGSGATVSHAYSSAGSFVVTLTVADGVVEAETSRSVTITAPVYSSSIVINELLPNPAGSDTSTEFIELQNTGTDSVDLAGWQLDDADGGSAPYTITTATILNGGSIKSFSRADTKLALNNTGDSVRLLDPSGVVKSSYTYSSSVPEGQSYNRAGEGSYSISTTLTPGAANTITAPVEDDEGDEEDSDEDTEKSTTEKKGKVAGTKATSVALKDIREEEEGTTLTTEGVVSVPPGVFGEREIYLAGSGIQLYFHKATWPDLKLGDRITVTGELGSNRGEARLKITEATSIVRGKSEAPPTPHIVQTGEISEDQEGWLVTVQGEVVETSGDTFYVDDGSGEVKIYIRSTTKIDKPKMKTGEAVTITGIVSETTSGYRILPRFQEDVRLGRVAGLTSFPATGNFSVWQPVLSFILRSQIVISR